MRTAFALDFLLIWYNNLNRGRERPNGHPMTLFEAVIPAGRYLQDMRFIACCH